jgi:hypothetical protein
MVPTQMPRGQQQLLRALLETPAQTLGDGSKRVTCMGDMLGWTRKRMGDDYDAGWLASCEKFAAADGQCYDLDE